ncbi:hypothetical protein HN51_017884 [Arachis hypogaea]
MITTSMIWKLRNEEVHSHSNPPLRIIDIRIKSTIKEVMDVRQIRDKEKNCTTVPIAWTAPSANWVKLNMDGASRGNLGPASCTSAFQNELGGWLYGFARKIGEAKAIEAKNEAILSRLELAWIQKGRDNSSSNPHPSLTRSIRRIRTMLKRNRRWKFSMFSKKQIKWLMDWPI